MNEWRKPGRKAVAAGDQFLPMVTFLGTPWGEQALDVAAEVRLRHERFDDAVRGGELGLLIDRHIDARTELPLGCFVDRDTPAEDVDRSGPYLSLAACPPAGEGEPAGGELHDADEPGAPHEREWDFLREHAAEALDEAGVGDDAADAQKVHAFAEYAMKFKKAPTYGSFHPVDIILHSSYCTGAANVLAALCSVSGIPSRHCCISNHTMTEVWLGERWHFADNHADGARFLEGCDYVDVTLDPESHEQFSDRQAGYLSHRRTWARSPWHYSGMLRWHWAWGEGKGRGVRTSVMDGYGVGVPCDPRHAAALYPGRGRYPFPCWNGEPELTLTEKGSWLRVDLLLPPGQKLRKSYHVGECDDNPVTGACVDWWFRGQVALEDAALLTGDGAEIRASGALPGTGGVSKLRFELPDGAAAPGTHDLVLVNRSEETLRAVAFPTPLVEPPAVATEGALRIRPQSLSREPVVV